MRTLAQRRRLDLAAGIVLALFLFRAYVPVGFMPAAGMPFLLEICPAGLQAPMPAHHAHHHMGAHSDFEDCPFGGAPGAGPISHFITAQPAARIVSEPVLAFELLPQGLRVARANRARGPPTLA